MLLFRHRPIFCVAIAFLALACTAIAAPISIFNTGVDASGDPRLNGAVTDLHYSLIGVPSGSTSTTRILASSGGFPIGPWIGDDLISAWIGPDTYQANGPAGNYTYRTTFTLAGLLPGTASLTGQWAMDNYGDGSNSTGIYLNGVSKVTNGAGYQQWAPFTISSGFVPGLNTLDFVISNADGPTGLRVEISGAAAPAVPEPGSVFLLAGGVGVGLLALYRRRAS